MSTRTHAGRDGRPHEAALLPARAVRRLLGRGFLWGGLLLWGALGAVQAQVPVPTQIEVPSPQRLSATTQVEAGVRLLRQGRVTDAVSLLRSVLRADSARTSPVYGAAAYWLGKAYQTAGRAAKARSTWRVGLRALRAHGQFDVRLADAYLRTLTPRRLRGERLYAADVYRSLLRRVGPDTSTVVRSLFRRRVAQLAPLMADSALARVIKESRSDPARTWTFRSRAGPALVEWWRGLDPYPATTANERLEEHMTRLVRVRKQYGCAGRASGLDDRGIVHLRFGNPYKQKELNYEDGKFFREVYRFGVNVPPSSFPDSEIWLYTHIAESGYYLFAEADTSDCFRMAQANELMPGYLTRQRADTERGLNIAYSALMAMRAIYRELALYHINFSARYSKIADYAGWQEMQAMAADMGMGTPGQRSVQVGAGVGQTRQVFSNPTLGFDFPTQFVTRMVSRARREDRAAADRREEAMPRQHTTLLEGAAQLPVAVRTARFLTAEGATRTEIYWGVPAAELHLGEKGAGGSSLISFSAVRYDARRQSSQRRHRRYQVNVQPGTDPRMIVPSPLTFEGVRELHHLGLQWGQYQLRGAADSASSGRSRLGPKRRMATARADSLEPLRAEGPRVEMSDVKAWTLADTTDVSLADPTARATPYPFRTLSADTPLLLSFELYHLGRGDQNRTRYSVAYEVEGETKRGWTRLFRGTDTQRTSTEMTREGTSRRTEEVIRLELSEIERDEPQEVRVTVRVTDEVTDATVARSVDFVLRPRGDAE